MFLTLGLAFKVKMHQKANHRLVTNGLNWCRGCNREKHRFTIVDGLLKTVDLKLYVIVLLVY